jgi:DNA polymerase III delta prime subunit
MNSGIKTCTSLIIKNNDEKDWQNIVVKAEGPLIQPQEAHIDFLAREKSVSLKSIAIEPNINELLGLTEAAATSFALTVTVDGEDYFAKDCQLRLLTYDEWTGTRIMPELIASFVVPNNPLLSRVKTKAAHLLEQWTGPATLDEYQTQDRNRVRAQVAAVYEALRTEGIVLSTSTTAFDAYGQRVRPADKVLTEKIATSLDAALLTASCLESIGIYPIVVMMNDSVLTGAWLTQTFSPQVVCDDVSYLQKEMADGNHNIVVIDPVAITASDAVAFEQAAERAMEQLKNESLFSFFIDIHRCRLDGIRPLPQRTFSNGQWQLVNEGVEPPMTTAGSSLFSHYDLHLDDTATPLTKQQIWERKLLDFSLRNNLINTRIGKRVVPFVSFGIDHLEDNLQDGKDYNITPCPNEKIEPGEGGMYDSSQQAAKYNQYVSELIANNRIVSYLTETELQHSLKHIYRTARTAIEENGANSLFLALGMLRWYETAKSTQPRFAPILLLPVDMVRKGGNNYIIRKRDEDIILNITLVELLKQNFKINLDQLRDLPKDESGVDVKLIFTLIRRAIINQRKWNVLEEALLGLFSFNKFVMWNDIHANADKLKENAVVSSLIEGHNKLEPFEDEADARLIDKNNAPMDFSIPLDVDSSQMEAIVESGKGHSFILHGPPGTGKSQTITNMIANALYHGKRVLFVAEKMAALSVVQARLAKLGLEPFCMELHSNKVTKKHFLTQMEKALNVTRVKSPEEFRKTSERLYAERMELIGYMETLHHKEACGMSLYECISEYLSIGQKEIDEQLPPAETIRADFLGQCRNYTAEIQAIIDVTGMPGQHPLRGMEPRSNSKETIEDIRRQLSAFIDTDKVLAEAWQAVEQMDLFNIETEKDLEWLNKAVEAMVRLPLLNARLLELASDENTIKILKEHVACSKQRESLMGRIRQRFSENAVTLNVDELWQQWNEINQKWFIPRYFAKRKYFEQLRPYGQIGEEDLPQLLSMVKDYQRANKMASCTPTDMLQPFGSLLVSGHEQWDAVDTLLNELPALNSLLMEHAREYCMKYKDLADRIDQAIDGQWKHFLNNLQQKTRRLISTYEQQTRQVAGFNLLTINEVSRQSLREHAQRWIDHLHLAKDWFYWADKKRELTANGLQVVALHIEDYDEKPRTVVEGVLKGIYHQLTDTLINANPQLRMFNGLLFEQKIEKYRQDTMLFQELSKKELYCRLAVRVPSSATASANGSEISILKRNIANGGRGTSIRSIIDNIPTLMPRLCPCILMSPISVAQFIDFNAEKFDLVIFDEASQMPTSEAVGAIARGKALVVVGDSRQMPPTSFFTSTQTDEEEADIDDMESILEDCKTLLMPEHYLSWHYRSKHESLIAFSNSQYYDNRLLTFPSVDDQQTKVTLVKIDGQYDKGRTRSNPEEAQAIVSEVMRRLADEQLRKYSIGIVSFSKVQQNLIEDLLTDEMDKNPDLKEIAFREHEPIFIKNLENVQGDERDVILFSVGYGPDKHGKVSMNFGPLNNAGGERRLNVAVSRARYEMMVFSTMTSGQIDLRRSNAKGVEGLKAFLEYAENGLLPQQDTAPDNANTGKRLLISQICEAIEEKGYTTTACVGRSSFKVDIAVSSSSDPYKYLLGIMCDGESYYATKTTRDREIVQPGILHALKWQTMRVYSIDWYEHREKVLARILHRLTEIENHPTKEESPEEVQPAYRFLVEQLEDEEGVAQPKPNERQRPYTEANITPPNIDKANYQPTEKYNLTVIKELLKAEQPLNENFLSKRLARIFGFGHAGANIQKAIEAAAPHLYRDAMSFDGIACYWLNENSARHYDYYRAPSARNITEIPLVEIANAIKEVVCEEFSLPKEKIPTIAARKLGFASAGAKINEIITFTVDQMERQRVVVINNNMVSLPES